MQMEHSDHLQIVRNSKCHLKGGKWLSWYIDLSFGIEMAKLEPKGGVMVILLQCIMHIVHVLFWASDDSLQAGEHIEYTSASGFTVIQ